MPSPQQRGRMGGLTSYAVRTPEQEANRKAAAATGRMRRFLEQVPADLPDDERQRRALALQRAHMQAIAAKSADRRRKPAA